ncbi:MAG TPA: GNAT family N-acetyltransferase, partial [Burkholderiaceae bacterium]|nr:GNAT family N-acetyltransferase [Burkholderiaceae bacterium]
PPLNRELALDMMARTRVARALDAFRGAAPVDLDALIRVLLRLSDLACELPAVQELDINPLLADHDGVIALDARIRVAADAPLAPDLRYSHLAIHPYPRHLERALALKDGATVRLRPIRPEDGQAEARFISRLTPQTLYLRFHVPVKELTRDRLVRFTQIDYDREMAFVAIDTDADPEEIRAIARYTRSPEGGSCEFGLTVEDRWQRRGLGQALLAALETHARCMGVQHIYGWVLSDNAVMRQLLQTRGYQKERGEQGAGHVLRFGRSLSEGM